MLSCESIEAYALICSHDDCKFRVAMTFLLERSKSSGGHSEMLPDFPIVVLEKLSELNAFLPN